jgi:hypothetical protein
MEFHTELPIAACMRFYLDPVFRYVDRAYNLLYTTVKTYKSSEQVTKCIV